MPAASVVLFFIDIFRARAFARRVRELLVIVQSGCQQGNRLLPQIWDQSPVVPSMSLKHLQIENFTGNIDPVSDQTVCTILTELDHFFSRVYGPVVDA